MTLPIRARIAAAVQAELNAAPAGTFDAALWPAGGAVRSRDPLYDLPELATARVTVLARSVDEQQASRDSVSVETVIDVAVQKKITGPPNSPQALAECDALENLVEAVIRYLRRRPLAAMTAATWTGTSNDPVYLPEHLREKRVFTSVISVTYAHGERG